MADVSVAVAVVLTFAWFLHLGRDTWFFADEWAMADQVRSPSGLIQPYNGHLSLLILCTYQVLLEAVGFSTHTPYQVVGLLSFVGVGVAMYVVVRRQVGAVAAVAAAAIVLWPMGVSLEAGGLNHSLVGIGAIVCAYGLVGRGRRRDLLVAGGLVFALASAGGGVAVAAGAIVHCACTRPGWRRWAAAVVPVVLWAVWYLAAVDENEAIEDARPGLVELVRFTFRHVAGSFSAPTLGNRFGGVVVALVVVVVLGNRLRRGLADAAPSIAWLVALLAWWSGLAWTRWILEEVPFRYHFLSSVFILLALLPDGVHPDDPQPHRAGLRWPGVLRRAAGHPAVAPVVLAGLALVLVPAIRPDAEAWAAEATDFAFVARGEASAIAFADAAQVPDGLRSFVLGFQPPSDVLAVLRAFDPPPGSGDLGSHVALAVTITAGPPRATCPEAASRQLEVAADANVLAVASDGGPATVQVSRFGAGWVAVATVEPGRPAFVALRGFEAGAPWTVRIDEGCVLPYS